MTEHHMFALEIHPEGARRRLSGQLNIGFGGTRLQLSSSMAGGVVQVLDSINHRAGKHRADREVHRGYPIIKDAPTLAQGVWADGGGPLRTQQVGPRSAQSYVYVT